MDDLVFGGEYDWRCDLNGGGCSFVSLATYRCAVGRGEWQVATAMGSGGVGIGWRLEGDGRLPRW